MTTIAFNIYNIVPMGKVRQNKADRWKARPCVLRYRDYCDRIRTAYFAAVGDRGPLDIVVKGHITQYVKLRVPDNKCVVLSVLSCYPQPASRSAKVMAKYQGIDCFKKPDADNLWGSVADALFDNDQRCKIGEVYRFWAPGTTGKIAVKIEIQEA